MKLNGTKITEATESELFSVYLEKEYDDVMDFHTYLRRCEELGTKILREEE